MRGAQKDSRFRSPYGKSRGLSSILILSVVTIGLFMSFLIFTFFLHGGKEGNKLKHSVTSGLKGSNSDSIIDGGGFETAHEDLGMVGTPKSLAIPEGLDGGERTMLIGIEEIRNMKRNKKVIEQDPEAQAKVPVVQKHIRTYLLNKYGPGPYMIEMDITLPNYLTAPVSAGGGKHAKLLIEMAPIEYVPYTNYFFLEKVVNGFKKGKFHRNAGHVLQAMISLKEGLKHTSFAWQEYSPMFSHQKYTLGFAGRPSGSSAIYVSTLDNTFNHGPGSQGSKTEADVCWGKLADQSSIDIVEIMKKQRGAQQAGFISDSSNFISIDNIRLVTTKPS